MLAWNLPWRRNKMIILLCQRKAFRSGAGQGGFWGTCKFLPCARLSRLVYACEVDSCLRSRFQINCSCRAWSIRAFCSSTHTYALSQWSSMAWYLDDLPCLLKIVLLCRWKSDYWEDTTGSKLLPRQLLALGRPEQAVGAGKHCLCRLQQELLLAGLGPECPAQKGLPFWKGLWSWRQQRVFRCSGWTPPSPVQAWHCDWRGFPCRLNISTLRSILWKRSSCLCVGAMA